MEIKTKYNIGDTVFFMKDSIPQKDSIMGICTMSGEVANETGRIWTPKQLGAVNYYFSNGHCVREEGVFPTKEELRESLFAAL